MTSGKTWLAPFEGARSRTDCPQAYAQPRVKAGEGSKRALGFDAPDAQSKADAAVAPKNAEGSEADLREMLGARDELMNRWRLYCLLVPKNAGLLNSKCLADHDPMVLWLT